MVGAVAGAPTIRRVASRPSISGMRMSMSTTSGRSRPTSATASAPSAASPTTSMSSAEPSSTTKPLRTSAWSSATATRITRRLLVGQPATTRKPPPGFGPGLERAAVHRDPLAHADEAVAAAVRRRGR